VELVQQAQAAQVEHQAMLLNIRQQSESFLKLRLRQDLAMRAGALLCLASAVAFGAMAIFGKLAYEQGATVGTLLAVRFVLAAALFWVLVLATGAGRHLRTLPRRDIGLALGLGAVGYSAQAGAYFVALTRLDASLLSLLLYTFPAMVTVAAIALGRERGSRRKTGALALASGGLVLVLAGAGAGALDPLGVLLGIAAAVVYTTYILTSSGVAERVGPLAIAVVSTVGAVSLFFAGLKRVGPTTASILSTAEPVTTVVLAFLAFGEALSPVQLGGGALVVGAVLVLSAPARRSTTARAAYAAT
jgi:drug/metabolite transporter (DMT)-like permease